MKREKNSKAALKRTMNGGRRMRCWRNDWTLISQYRSYDLLNPADDRYLNGRNLDNPC